MSHGCRVRGAPAECCSLLPSRVWPRSAPQRLPYSSFSPFGNEQVGSTYANGVLLPTNQWISPLGKRLFLDNARIVTSSISPDGHTLAALTWNNYDTTLTLVNLTNGTSQAYPLYNGYYLSGASDPYANEDGTVGNRWTAVVT